MKRTDKPKIPASKPKREDFKNEVEYNLAMLTHYYKNREARDGMGKIIKLMKTNLLHKSSLGIND